MEQHGHTDGVLSPAFAHGSIIAQIDPSGIDSNGSNCYGALMSTATAALPHAPRWSIRLLRWAWTVTAALMFGQSVLAGLFMGGAPAAFDLHRDMATISGIALMVGIATTIVARIVSRSPRWPIGASIGLLGLMSLQAFAGFRSLVALHVPLGVIVIVLTVGLTVWSWRWPSHCERQEKQPVAPGAVDERPGVTTPSR
ncbi:hypothetical protein MUN74_18750 [Agromyces endophyticus]|uniref:hypothetical protein n=1 Tax=Agromyces sp. H17E-10 TaxID=2932244 RepID=UPI001FD493A8|nr:hypothetical protein [Agromyces sp. H17E-10]UOQ89267.1 hypothetical protein MUN74_18750 [Agromyces sp. H17E-10]